MLHNLENSPKLLQQIQNCRGGWRLFELIEPTEQQPTANLTRYRIIPCTCGSSACPYCRKRKLNQIRQKLLKKGIDQRWYMFTLAGVHHPGEESSDLKRLEISFRKLIQHVKRKHKKIEYVAIKELSPSGNWHYHGFWNFRFDWYELRDAWRRYSGSNSVYLKQIFSPDGAINYSITYMLKKNNFEQEACTLHANRSQKCTTSKQFYQKETARKLYKEVIISSEETKFFFPSLKHFIKEQLIRREEISFIDFPYESELFKNIESEAEDNYLRYSGINPLPDLIF